MEQKSIQEVIQLFCSICSRGVIVRNESMYKCKKCGKEVCQMCFDRQARLCTDCTSEEKKESANIEYKPVKVEVTELPRKQNRKRGLLFVISGMVVIIAAFLVGAMVNLHSALVGVLELLGFALFIKGFLIIKD